ncbi:hypothetical protein [Lysobacter enzymogenes]|uniref:hypothetical protein n=1 Tax=Lysobacter enzymogenes TaxID=69 RepID=UPI001113E94B|nr:hypothetical protein [Lysobacter enzymogenes]
MKRRSAVFSALAFIPVIGSNIVIPAKAGIHFAVASAADGRAKAQPRSKWIPAFAGMTNVQVSMTNVQAPMTNVQVSPRQQR